ncbi:MAG: hypothetical protein ACQEQL_07675 [Pseudomonadota bacterium]
MHSSTRRRPVSRTPREQRSPPTQFLILSLFLILLAFFIALTAGAEFDDNKTDPVLNSLEDSFPVNRLRGQGVPSVIEQSNIGRDAGQALDEIEGIFNSSQFPFKERTTREKGAVIVSMPVKDVEELLDIAPLNIATPIKRQSFLASLSGLLQPQGADRNLMMSIIVYSRRPPSRLAVIDRTALTERVLKAERYVSAFEQQGLSPERMMIGIQRGNTDEVSFIFSPAGQEE